MKNNHKLATHLLVLMMYGIIILVNIPASFLRQTFDNNTKDQRLRFALPGYVIPIIWFIPFPLMGTARFLVVKHGAQLSTGKFILALAVLCASCAYYTQGPAKLTAISPHDVFTVINFAQPILICCTCIKYDLG